MYRQLISLLDVPGYPLFLQYPQNIELVAKADGVSGGFCVVCLVVRSVRSVNLRTTFA